MGPGRACAGRARAAATLVDRFVVVRPFLPMLCTAILFGATAEATRSSARSALPDLLDARPSGRVPAGYLDARKVAVDPVPPGWARVVFTPGRPDATVNRAGYVFCVLELFHQRLRRRDIFALASTRWSDPRAQLLADSAWEPARGPVLNALQLPHDPDALLAEHARDLDAALRHVACRLIANTEVSIDEQAGCTPGRSTPSRSGYQLNRA